MEFCVKLLSLPLWERGLKCKNLRQHDLWGVVAPLVGAWIEIPFFPSRSLKVSVAPLVGAWIEIPCNISIAAPDEVAPLVGAWIEIRYPDKCQTPYKSLPLWERGLKYTKMRG